jgi:trypsin
MVVAAIAGALCVLPQGAAASPGGDAGGKASPRIVGGATTTISEWPWQAAIVLDHDLFPDDDFERQLCGGSVIAATFVLSAAHCFESLSAVQVEVVTGRTQLSDGAGQRVNVAGITVHPGYNPITFENDFAVLRLAEPTSQPRILLAGSAERGIWEPGDEAWVTGWGATSQGGAGSDILREALVPIVSDSVCGQSDVYGSAFSATVMVCAGFLTGGVDSCQGDSGGPLVSPLGDGQWRLVGVVSWGDGCAQPNAPGVYTRIGADPLRADVQSIVTSLGGPNVLGASTPAAAAGATTKILTAKGAACPVWASRGGKRCGCGKKGGSKRKKCSRAKRKRG